MRKHPPTPRKKTTKQDKYKSGTVHVNCRFSIISPRKCELSLLNSVYGEINNMNKRRLHVFKNTLNLYFSS